MKKIVISFSLLVNGYIAFAQDKAGASLDHDPDKLKIIPDKILEFGIPLLFLFLLLNTVVAVLKHRAEHQLKLRMVDRGVSEESLLKIFRDANMMATLQPLKWFLFTAANAIGLASLHLLKNYLVNQSGYLAVAIILLFNALAFGVYYNILSKKINT